MTTEAGMDGAGTRQGLGGAVSRGLVVEMALRWRALVLAVVLLPGAAWGEQTAHEMLKEGKGLSSEHIERSEQKATVPELLRECVEHVDNKRDVQARTCYRNVLDQDPKHTKAKEWVQALEIPAALEEAMNLHTEVGYKNFEGKYPDMPQYIRAELECKRSELKGEECEGGRR